MSANLPKDLVVQAIVIANEVVACLVQVSILLCLYRTAVMAAVRRDLQNLHLLVHDLAKNARNHRAGGQKLEAGVLRVLVPSRHNLVHCGRRFRALGDHSLDGPVE